MWRVGWALHAETGFLSPGGNNGGVGQGENDRECRVGPTWRPRPVLALPFSGTVTCAGHCPLRRMGGRMVLTSHASQINKWQCQCAKCLTCFNLMNSFSHP